MRTIGSWKNKLFKRREIKQIVEYDGEDINIIGRKLKIMDFFSKNTNKYLTTRGA
jgi:ribosomal protein S24E